MLHARGRRSPVFECATTSCVICGRGKEKQNTTEKKCYSYDNGYLTQAEHVLSSTSPPPRASSRLPLQPLLIVVTVIHEDLSDILRSMSEGWRGGVRSYKRDEGGRGFLVGFGHSNR